VTFEDGFSHQEASKADKHSHHRLCGLSP
jgi:hypothetical protein